MEIDKVIEALEGAQKIIKNQEEMILLLKAKIDFLERNREYPIVPCYPLPIRSLPQNPYVWMD